MPGLHLPEPTWDATARVWHWLLDPVVGPRSGKLWLFEHDAQEILKHKLQEIRERAGTHNEYRE